MTKNYLKMDEMDHLLVDGKCYF